MSADSKSYKDTINLPQTTFPMRGDLVKNEPARLAKWESLHLYQRIQTRRKKQGAPRFILHDGPPFANGDVHMGTALNKVLKDLVLKSKTMAGFETPFIPGWDCHGLPIEFKVVQQARDLEPVEVRRRSAEFAKKFIDIQRNSFKRLGVFGDWDNPYLTLDPAYESDVIRVFAKMVEDGLVYQSKKPVQWSYGAHTALAEAEVEYKDKVSPSIYVKFPLTTRIDAIDADISMAIWTTTPWTLPANLGIALHPQLTYVVGRFENTESEASENFVIVRELVDAFAEKTSFKLVETLAEKKGEAFLGLAAQHPFLPRTSKIINANFVTTETGTGAVHVAPGHGADDYVAGQQNDLGLVSPVNDDGEFTEEVGVPALVGQHVFKANSAIIEMLTENGTLLGAEKYKHSYPHCWRSKTPIIFRSVEQFFISIDSLRERALEEIDNTKWLPAWGQKRIYGTVEARPDWCISRQRTWGVPLPVFFDAHDQAILDADLVRKVADHVETEGTNFWFEKSDAELAEMFGLPADSKRCRDTLDVWIDSGCSHLAVLERHPELSAPADLYLEGTDQHRGWFQSSLMLSIAWRDSAPYKEVVTIGFVVDKDKKKLSKSEAKKAGKPIDAAHYYNKYGSDIVRLWVSSVDWQTEVPFGEDLFKQVTEPYRRLRNTFRILLGNLDGYNNATDRVAADDMPLVDRWILERLHQVVKECRTAYQQYEFRKVFNQVNQFCATDLSAVYIDMLKDRMYCDAPDSLRRRSSQTAMYDVFSALARLLAPIISFTADEAWEHAGLENTVHEQDFPIADEAFAGDTATKQVERLLELRYAVQTAIEAQIQAKVFNKNNEAHVTLTVPANEPVAELLRDRDFATEFFIIADMDVQEGSEVTATVKKSTHPMCPRCRRYEPIAENSEELCQRCHDLMA